MSERDRLTPGDPRARLIPCPLIYKKKVSSCVVWFSV